MLLLDADGVVDDSDASALFAAWDEKALLYSYADQAADRFAVDETIAPGSTHVWGGLEWRALAAPGHDRGALVFFNPEHRILVSGDALWQRGFGFLMPRALDPRAMPGARATLDLIAGRIQAMMVTTAAVLPQVQAGQIRAIAVTSPERWRLLPQTEAVAEQVPGYVSENWYGLAAPPSTPDAVIGFLSARVLAVMRDPANAARFDDAGLHPAVMELADYDAFLRADSARWERVVRTGNIRIDG